MIAILSLNNITKEYRIGATGIMALRGIKVHFRKNEFVSVLGPSGCGKTTLLNIIGGLDRYTNGDLIISGKSTKEFTDKDWDAYRNHSVGFVFQSYNLIPHQTALSNVELALTLSGVSKAERRRRAKEALHRVGLADQMDKKPAQMSGGQMQRVAIARAIVNDPEILLCDEPTGALDSVTSVQIMDLLKEISADKLVIMVTHNPDLADRYSTRIIRLLDGRITDDSDPFDGRETASAEMDRKKRPSMRMHTALSLSFQNLLTKKARTFLTSFAGSIGIIGIALILSISSGARMFIQKVEEDTLSSYPISITDTAVDISGIITSLMGKNEKKTEPEDGKIYSSNVMTDLMQSMMGGMSENNLEAFKKYLDDEASGVKELSSDIQYTYSTPLNIYKADTSQGIYRVNPAEIFAAMGFERPQSPMSGMSNSLTNENVWTPLLDNQKLLETQYEILKGKLPEKNDEIVLIVGKDHTISDYTLYALGLKDKKKLTDMIREYTETGKLTETKESIYTYDDLLGLKYKLLVNSEYYEKTKTGLWADRSKDDLYVMSKLENARELQVVGIVCAAEGASVADTPGIIGYRSGLMKELILSVNDSDIAKEQMSHPDTDVFTGLKFPDDDASVTMDDVTAYVASLPAEESARIAAYLQTLRAEGKTEAEIAELFSDTIRAAGTDATLEDNLTAIGVADLAKPDGVMIYPKDFESKEIISDKIKEYNNSVKEADQITYTDYVGLMLSSVTTIIDAISYILIAFVAISLVVSSIMIGIITYISVLERTKEIGILRSIGASKKDISRVFNAETLIVGLTAGALGIGLTALLILPTNLILHAVTKTTASAVLPWQAGLILVGISMLLTWIAGLIPSRLAAKKDPVIALRTE